MTTIDSADQAMATSPIGQAAFRHALDFILDQHINRRWKCSDQPYASEKGENGPGYLRANKR
jgi:hypothetical protein